MNRELIYKNGELYDKETGIKIPGYISSDEELEDYLESMKNH